METTTSIHYSLNRQVNHWLQAAIRLSALDNLASGNAWHGIEHKMGLLLKSSLKTSIDEVIALANSLRKQLENGNVIDNFSGTVTHSWERLLSWIVTSNKMFITGI